MGILITASSDLMRDNPTVAINVEKVVADGLMVDHVPDLEREVEKAERSRAT